MWKSYYASTIVEFLSQSEVDRVSLFLAWYAFQAAIHTVWRERNAWKDGEVLSSEEVNIKFIDKAVRNRVMSLQRNHARALGGAYQTWNGAVQIWSISVNFELFSIYVFPFLKIP